jgi:hypothetical protein
MMLAGLPVPADAIDELAALIRDTGADELADRLEQALVNVCDWCGAGFVPRAPNQRFCSRAHGRLGRRALVSHGPLVLTVGERPPAMSISWAPPVAPVDSGYLVFFADLLPDDPGFDELPTQTVCLHCLIADGDEQLGRGLDLAREHGQVDWDPDAEEWFVPDDADRSEEEPAEREDREQAAAADDHVEHDLGIGRFERGLES